MPTFISADYGSLDLQLRFIDMKYKFAYTKRLCFMVCHFKVYVVCFC